MCAAAGELASVVRRTPVLPSRVLSDHVGHPVGFKCENLQRTGSFKPRGAYLRIARLGADERSRGVVAASAGNHAQGVAWAAATPGLSATVFMPTEVPIPKLLATKAYGATVHLVGESVDHALAAAQTFAEDTGAVLIHPFDHLDVVAGQSTVGLEIVEQMPEVGTVVVPTGGGGLLAGIAAAVRALRPRVRVIGVQAASAAAWPASLAAGHPVRADQLATMADGIAVGLPGEVPFAHVSQLVDEIVTVTEEELARALLLCLERSKLVVEPAGAAAVAALMCRDLGGEGPVCAVVSGGNIDPLLLTHVTTHGLRAVGRYLAVRVTISDRPGSLLELLRGVSGCGAGVVDVVHSRITGQLEVGEVEVELILETRGPDHQQQVLEAIRAVASQPVQVL
ncbi:threonine ammonia-lyase [Rhodococcus sp. D2-41]|uniref:threonine ammonia-lyase n=1 Tax=Speluncibacter jeojiensis TaxID=2710754 RepID=UPI00241017A3|nr:threonine ammonia-lyase [Rhodococcus sp. D2-41]MDG3012319.1 threonine ammonia-lyase [Rhodococcus sp. D2-41]